MELKDYLDLLRKRWWLPLVSVFVVGLIGYLLTPAPEILYRSTVKVLLNQSRVAIPDENTIREAQRIANTYAELMKVDRVIALVRQNVDSPSGVGDIRSRIEVDVVPNTNIMNISVEDPDPQMAADIANELVAVFIQQVEAIEASNYRVSIRELEEQISDVQVELDQVQADLSAAEDRVAQLEAAAGISAGQDGGSEIAEARRDRNQLQAEYDQLSRRYDSLLNSLQELNVLNAQEAAIMTVVEDAGRGTRVTPRPQRLVNALQGALGGLVIGLGGVFLLEQLRVNIKSSREIERIAGMGTLGVIATIKGSNTEDKLVAARRPRSPIAEAYRVLRTNIEFTDPDHTPRSLVITSASPAEGKTVTAVNLATTFAQSGKRVILVDADLRRPALHKILGVTNSYGLSTALLREQGESLANHLLRTEVTNLFLMPSGPLPPNPADMLSSRRMQELLDELTNAADIVVFDTPPLLAVADPTLLSRLSDGTVLVVQAGSTRADALRRSVDQLKQSGATILGVVLNRASGSEGSAYYRYYEAQDA